MSNPRETAEQSKRKRTTRSHGKVFISYRRDDSATICGHMHDWLTQRVDKNDVFFDINAIQYGVDFERDIARNIPQCKAVLAVIGPHWITDQGLPSPHVIQELELAQKVGVPIIPVLVDGGVLPADEYLPPTLHGFAKLNAAQVRAGRDFEPDMQGLATALHFPVKPRSQAVVLYWTLAACAVILLGVGVYALLSNASANAGGNSLRTQATLNAEGGHQTATVVAAGATATAAVETATASAIAGVTATAAAPLTYTAAAPGPGPGCDPNGAWQSSASPPDSTVSCSATGTTLQTSGSEVGITFTGARGFTFPDPYTVSVVVSGMHNSCASLKVFWVQGSFSSSSYVLQICGDTGNAVVFSISTLPGRPQQTATQWADTLPIATSYQLAITATTSSLAFSINSRTVYTSTVSDPVPPARNVTISGSVGDGPPTYGKVTPTLVVSDFSIRPAG